MCSLLARGRIEIDWDCFYWLLLIIVRAEICFLLHSNISDVIKYYILGSVAKLRIEGS